MLFGSYMEFLDEYFYVQVTLPRLRSISSDQSNTGSSEPAAVSSLKVLSIWAKSSLFIVLYFYNVNSASDQVFQTILLLL